MSRKKKRDPGYTMSSAVWPGLAKVVEECGEVIQICGKIIGNKGKLNYYDNINLRKKLQEEVADLRATLIFLEFESNLDSDFIDIRIHEKLTKYYEWKKNKE